MKVRKITALLLAALMCATLLCGCGGKSEYASESSYAPQAPAGAYLAEDALYEYGESESAASGSSGISLPAGRKWIVTVNMNAETEDLDSIMSSVNQKIAQLGGYSESQNITNGSSYSSRRIRRASLTVRIPVDKLGEFTEEIQGITNVVSHSQSAKDVTLSYVDTESRIAALKTEESRLLELMAQAEDLSDLLVIEERLTEVRYELERYGSNLRVMDNQIDFATIYLDIEEVQEYTPVEQPGFVERLTSSFAGSVEGLWENLQNFVIFLIAALPHLLILGIVVFVIVIISRAISRKNSQRRMAKMAKAQAMWAAQRQNQPPVANPPHAANQPPTAPPAQGPQNRQ